MQYSLLRALALGALGALYTPLARAQEICPPGPGDAEAAVHVTTETGKTVMVMGGLPPWLFVLGVVALIGVSFVAVEVWAPTTRRGFRWNLLARRGGGRGLYRLVQSRWFQVLPQLLMIVIFGGLIYAGLAGSRVQNVTPVAVWTVWWAGLIFAILLLGPIWCFVCPWDGLANLVGRLSLAARVEPLSLGLELPSWLRNVYPAILLFVLLSWAELGLEITTDPRTTAYLGLGMAAAAIAAILLFEDKAFCHHLCLVGRINGIYANFAPVEVRAYRPGACATCETEDCLNGNERGYACPTGISLKTAGDATYCTFCTECVKTCPRENVAFNLRPFGSDLKDMPRPRMDEAWLALALLSLTLFHGLSMTTAWESHLPGADSLLKWMKVELGLGHMPAFTLAMAAVVALPIGMYAASCQVAQRMTATSGVPFRALFVRYAYSLLPVALFYHLAHNAMHLLKEGTHLIPMLSDPLGTGADLFGTRGLEVGPLMSDQTLWYVQVALIVTGHVFGVLVAHRMSRKLYVDPRAASRSLVPMLVLMLLISAGGLSLMVMDMNMRMGRM